MRKSIGAILLFFVVPLNAAAQVVINEIAWMGTPLEGVDAKQWWRYEWVELYNAGDAAVRLDGWNIELHRERLDFTIGLYGIVGPKEYFLIGASDRILGVDVNYASLAGKFANAGQRVVLKSAAGEVVEEIDTREKWFGGDNEVKLTMERRFPDRGANDPENWGSSQNAGGTPNAENSVFGRERFLQLDERSSLTLADATKRDPVWVSLLQVLTERVFMTALLVALGSAVAILVLRRYLVRSQSQDASSSGVRRD